MKHTWLVSVSLLVLLAGCAPGNVTGTPVGRTQDAAPVIALVNGTLIDGTGTDPLADAVVLIQNGRFLAVGTEADVMIPEGAQVIDVQGGTILPGLINAHVHGAYNSENLSGWLQAGVTTVRDEAILDGGNLADLLALRDGTLNQPQYARLISAGSMITAPNGYGSLYAASVDEARQVVQNEIDAGVDLIKVSEEDGIAGQHGLPLLTAEQLTALVETAHQNGLPVSAHITDASYLGMILDAGVDDVAHLPYNRVSDEDIQQMLEKNIYQVTTFTVLYNYSAVGESVDNLRREVEAGVQIAVGDDFMGGGATEAELPVYEFQMMKAAGMTPMQIIVAATRNGAHVCNRDADLGTVEVGKIADVLVVNANPLENLRALRDPWMVIKDGVIVVEPEE